MPHLGLESLAPSSKPPSTGYGRGIAQSEAGIKLSPVKPELLKKRRVSNAEDDFEEIIVSKYPIVKLDTDKIMDATAARLATSLLGHVLFLKSQVPFPVMQLGRIPGGKTNPRAAKHRAELLASFDTLSSHLDTTFSGLLTALARCSGYSNSKLAQAHLAILVGPSIGSAKSKVILGIEGLEPSIWGMREDISATVEQKDEDSDEEEGEDEESDEDSDANGEVPEDSEEEDDASEDENDDEDADEVPSSSPSPPCISYADQQKFLQNADRLLSRTLAAADADGNGIASEMSPTQTHILIRAPRRFSHPAWIPRQNVTISLESSLQDFMNNSGLGSSDVELDSHIKDTRKGKVEGVWITARGGLHRRSLRDTEPAANSESRNGTEDDDMIWWSWDGKFVGFSEW